MREILSAGIAAALFFSASLVLPFAGLFALPFASVPIVRTAHRRGTGPGLAAAALSCVLVFLLGWSTGTAADSSNAALLAAIWTGLPAIFAGAVRQGSDPSRAYLGLCFSGLALAGAFLLGETRSADRTMGQEIDRRFDELLQLSGSRSARSPVDPETAARVRATLEATRDFCKRFWIGLIGVSWTFASAIGFYTGAWSGRPSASAEATRFEKLRVSALVVPFFVAAGAGWALGSGLLGRIAGNLLWQLLALYFVAGLSIICHFARKWFRARFLRIGLYALVIYVPVNVGVALLGLFDWYVDFRHRGGEIRES